MAPTRQADAAADVVDDAAVAGAAELVDELTAGYRAADGAQRRIVAAALACIARWGVAKTSLDDIAREAGVGRATVYRAVPGGKDRVLELVLARELGRVFHELDAEMAAATDLPDLLSRGLTAALRTVADHPALRTMLELEPERVLPTFTFDRLDRPMAVAVALAGPHLARFLPPGDVRVAADWVTRLLFTYSLNPTTAVDPHRPETVRRIVQTYLVPALTSEEQ
jgi:AcrR family transcriptional regulator